MDKGGSMNNITLFQVAAEYRSMADRLSDLDLDEQTIIDTLESESGELTTKAQNVAFVVRNLEASADAIKEAESQMAARRKAIEKRADRIREYLKAGMQIAGISKIESPYFTISLRRNPPTVDVFDASQVPEQYMRTPPPPPPAVDRKAISDALKAGEDVPGCRLTQSERIEIK